MADRTVAPPPSRPGAGSLIRSQREASAAPSMVAPAFVPESPSVADSVAPTVPVPVPGGSSEPRGRRSEVKMTVTVGEERRARLRTGTRSPICRRVIGRSRASSPRRWTRRCNASSSGTTKDDDSRMLSEALLAGAHWEADRRYGS
uniref:Uncharacterized protein n=1 Tax=Leifsonia xyli subsp. cynodontis TaxID=31966 RepID=Q6XGD0_LEIXC|nr:unknown [Leifsonia xyli subsp. cynodontis]